MIRKVVVPSAGLGTRLFPVTKEQPKEMLPIFTGMANNKTNVAVKPFLQLVFEQLYDYGLRQFCFVVGREKRAIEDHFTPDGNCIVMLESRGKNSQASDLKSFYNKLKTSSLIWINQSEPKGFGDAVLTAQPFVQNEPFLVHAGDTYIISREAAHLKTLMKIYERLRADAIFIVREVEDPHEYGVIEAEESEKGIYDVRTAVEKPVKPPTNLTIVPLYIFQPKIFKALKETAPDKGGELQLTDGIQKLIEWGSKVCAIQLKPNHIRLDVGSPEKYWDALQLSYHYARKLKI